MSDSFAPPPRRNILLILSVCLNVALIALIAAGIWRATHPQLTAVGGILSPVALMHSVPAERDRIQGIVNAHAPRLEELRAAAGATRLRAYNLLSSPGYSPAAFTKSLDAVRTADAALEAELVATMSESLAALSPAERKALVEKIRRQQNSWLYKLLRRRGRL